MIYLVAIAMCQRSYNRHLDMTKGIPVAMRRRSSLRLPPWLDLLPSRKLILAAPASRCSYCPTWSTGIDRRSG